jgi:hypothetical protein
MKSAKAGAAAAGDGYTWGPDWPVTLKITAARPAEGYEKNER